MSTKQLIEKYTPGMEEYFSSEAIEAISEIINITSEDTSYMVPSKNFWEDVANNKRDLNNKLGLTKENEYRRIISIPNVIEDKVLWLNREFPDWMQLLDETSVKVILNLLMAGGERLMTQQMKGDLSGIIFPEGCKIPRVGSKTSTFLRQFIPVEYDYIFNSIVAMMNANWIIDGSEDWCISTNPVDFLYMGVGNGFGSCLHPYSDHFDFKAGVYWHMAAPETFIMLKRPTEYEDVSDPDGINIEERFLVHDFKHAFALGRYYGYKTIPERAHVAIANLLGLENLSRVVDTIKYWRLDASYLIYVNDQVRLFSSQAAVRDKVETKFKQIKVDVFRECQNCSTQHYAIDLVDYDGDCPECA